MGIITVLWEKWVEFRRDFIKITLTAMISPLMYLIVFGLGVRTTYDGEPYMRFLIPGLVSMATMTGSFSAIAQSMSVQRLYEKALDQVMVSPTPLWQFIAGQIIGGSLRGMYAGCVIMGITAFFSNEVTFTGLSFLIMFLNGTVFATIALTLSFLAKSYADTPRLTTYVITPMTFLCNTFFSAESMPAGLRQVISILPLSQTSGMMRAISRGQSTGWFGFAVLGAYLVVFGIIATLFIYKKKNL